MTVGSHLSLPDKVAFGAFTFDRVSRQLWQDDQPLRLRKRELDLLNVLIEQAGAIVSETELIAGIGGGPPISEANLRVQLAGLQRVLGDAVDGRAKAGKDLHILHVPGAGYSFQATVTAADAVARGMRDAPRRHNLPTRHKPLVGRDTDITRVLSLISRHRQITICGDGGVGKTTLALAAATGALADYRDGVWLIDLAGVGNAALVAEAITATFALPSVAASRRLELVDWLADKEILLILDNCEHLAAAVGDLVSEILERTDRVRLLLTSRVVLGTADEIVVALAPLEVPPENPLTPDIALTFPAVAFFVESLRHNGRIPDLDLNTVQLIIQLCRALNGNPLAIELAAARVCIMGPSSLASQPEVLTAIAREGASLWKRQDVVLAALEWSYDGLSHKARLLLARLSVCRREFTQATAQAIAGDQGLSSEDITAGLAELTAKSLIAVAEFAEPVIYHMLVMVRDFAGEQLRGMADHNEVARRHALNCQEQLRYSGSDTPDQSHAASIDDIRAAVEWSFSDAGDTLTGMRLISMAVDNKKKLYDIKEYARQLDRALARYDALSIIEPRLQLRIIVERMCINQHGLNDTDLMARLKTRAFELAQGIYAETGDPADLFAIHQTAFSLAFGDGNGPEKKLYARQMVELAERSGNTAVIEIMATRLAAQAHHFMGEHSLAVPLMQKIMAMSDSKIRKRVYIPGDRVDPRITMAILNARSSWLLGKPQQATEEARVLVETVRANWDYVLCYVIAFSALPIAIWRGDIPGARIHLDDLRARADDFKLDYWMNWGDCYERAVAFFEGGGLTLAEPVQAIVQNNMQFDLLATLNESLLTQDAVERVEAGFVGWCAPEVLRNDAERALAAGNMTAIDAEEQLCRALRLAERQQALSWQLRTATSLGRLWRYQGRTQQAADLLRATTAKFSEGFADSDFVNAMALLKDL